jgi:hypothetical protein
MSLNWINLIQDKNYLWILLDVIVGFYGMYLVAEELLNSQEAVAYRGEFKTQLKLRSFEKTEPNFQFRGKYIRNNLIRLRISLVLKLGGNPD